MKSINIIYYLFLNSVNKSIDLLLSLLQKYPINNDKIELYEYSNIYINNYYSMLIETIQPMIVKECKCPIKLEDVTRSKKCDFLQLLLKRLNLPEYNDTISTNNMNIDKLIFDLYMNYSSEAGRELIEHDRSYI